MVQACLVMRGSQEGFSGIGSLADNRRWGGVGVGGGIGGTEQFFSFIGI